MLTGGRLLSSGVATARRQAWAFFPLFVGAVLARLIGLMPTLTLAARFVRLGKLQGVDEPALAYLAGLLAGVDDPAPWAGWAAGSLIAIVGGWLLSTVLQAGALRQLAAQASTTEEASDESFSEGILRAPASYLVTAAFVEILKFLVIGCVLGALVTAGGLFVTQPGAGSALMMTVAVALLIAMPFLVAALELGFARAVILEESPSVALAEGLYLFGQRAFDFVPPWYMLKLVGLVFATMGGFASLMVGTLPGDQGLWILRLGPSAMVSLTTIALATVVAFAQLSVSATLVAESAGKVPEPPAPPPTVLRAVALGPDEPILTAFALDPNEPVLVAREVQPESPESAPEDDAPEKPS